MREILSDKEMQDIFEYNSDDIENRYLQRDGWVKTLNKSGEPTVMPNNGLKSQKELWTILAFATWKKVFKMNI